MQRFVQEEPQRGWGGKSTGKFGVNGITITPITSDPRSAQNTISEPMAFLLPSHACWLRCRGGLLYFLITASILVSSRVCNAQWKQLDIGQPGDVFSVAVIDSNVYAGTLAGIYRSTDWGNSWTEVSGAAAHCFTRNGAEIFAGCEHGVVRSTDGGKTWAAPDSGMSSTIYSIIVSDSVMYAGGNGIYRSTDDGMTWTQIENGLDYYETLVTGVAVDGVSILASTAGGVIASTDGGNIWTGLVGTGSLDQLTNCVAAYDSTILVGWPNGLMRSTDDGHTWTRPNVSSGTVLSVLMDSSYAYVGTLSGVRISSDGGATWANISNGLPGGQIESVTNVDTMLFAATLSNGVFRSRNNGIDWTTASNGIIGSDGISLAGYGPYVFAVMNPPPYTGQDSLYVSTDYGNTWTSETNPGGRYVYSISTVGSEVFAVTRGGLFLSTDVGKSWTLVSAADSVSPGYPSAGSVVGTGTDLVASSGYGIFVSSDNGINWNNAMNSPPGTPQLVVSGQDVFAGADSGIYVSGDNGESWSGINDTLTHINAMATSGGSIFAGRFQWPYSSLLPPTPPGGIFRSTDNGRTWSTFVTGLPEYPQVFSLGTHGQDIFAGLEAGFGSVVYPGTFYASEVGQNNWHNESKGLAFLSVETIYVNDSSIYVGTAEGGVWRAPLSQVSGIVRPSTVTAPSTYHLLQNYPNPFNPTTNIEFEIPEREHVMLDVFDVLGRKVRTLVNAEMPLGTYNLTLNASRLATGVYFYRLRAGSFTQTKKMVLIK